MNNLVLLLDDDPIINFVHKRMVVKYGLIEEPLVFEEGEKALKYLRKHYHQYENVLILLDINMPEVNGWDFLDEISIWPECDKFQVIMLTSSVAEEDVEKSQEYGLVKGYVSKPLDENKVNEIQNLSEV